MNWTGGVKRRLIVREEEKRKQQMYFSNYKPKKLAEGIKVEGIQIKTGTKVLMEDENNSANTSLSPSCSSAKSHETKKDENALHNISTPSTSSKERRLRSTLPSGFKFSSIHTPYSKLVVKMEMDSRREKKKNDKNISKSSLYFGSSDRYLNKSKTVSTSKK